MRAKVFRALLNPSGRRIGLWELICDVVKSDSGSIAFCTFLGFSRAAQEVVILFLVQRSEGTSVLSLTFVDRRKSDRLDKERSE